MADLEQSRRVSQDLIQRAADAFERRQSLELVKQMEENERRRRMLSFGEEGRSKSVELAIQLQEEERARLLAEREISIMDDEKDRFGGMEYAVTVTEEERTRRLEEGVEEEPSAYWTELNESLHKTWNKQKAIELEETEKSRRVAEFVGEQCADAFQRRLSGDQANQLMDRERDERIGEQFAASALDKVWKSLNRKKSLDLVEAERRRRIGAATFSQAGDEALRQQQIRKVHDLQESERSRRIASNVGADTASLAVRRLSLQSLERLLLEGSEEKEGPGYSELHQTVADEFSEYVDNKERRENVRLVKEAEELERGRRSSIDNNSRVLEQLERFHTQQLANQLMDEERSRRIGEHAAHEAASLASSLLGRRQSANLQEEERLRRIREGNREGANELAEIFADGLILKNHHDAAVEAASRGERRTSIQESILASELERMRRLENESIRHDAPLAKFVSEAFQEGYQKRVGEQVFCLAAAVGQLKHSRSVLNNLEESERERRLSLDQNQAINQSALVAQLVEGYFQ